MSLLLYNIFLFFYKIGIYAYALVNQKAKKWIDGRRQWKLDIARALRPGEQRVWLHCASLGEFEQGRPLMELLKEKYPDYKIVITFFSPSGYEVRKDYSGADYVFYLPLDGKENAKAFVSLVSPAIALFIKYEFWHYYLRELHVQKIPAILVSAAFRKEQVFFAWYGQFFRNLLACFNWIFVQDQESEKLLQGIGLHEHVSLSGDTRYDRVSAIAAKRTAIPGADQFKGDGKLIIAGSTWPDDEKIWRACVADLPPDWKIIIAPHEIDAAHLASIRELFGNDCVFYSSLRKEAAGYAKKILIIDNIGLLSGLYAYGDIAYIGGGFQKGGIHNILEPAVFGLPVIFGPVYEKFVEAKRLVALQYGFPVGSVQECKKTLQQLIQQDDYRLAIQRSLIQYMRQHTGASAVILASLEQENWLKGV